MTPELPIADLTAYLAARKSLVAARGGYFYALRAYLRPEQRPDAERLGDLLALAPARSISEEEWVANPVRGYLTVLESIGSSRPFRLCVLQQGYELRVGIRCSADLGAEFQNLQVFASNQPLLKRSPRTVMWDWHFDVCDLYKSAQAFEDAVYKVGAVFEAALQTFCAPTTND